MNDLSFDNHPIPMARFAEHLDGKDRLELLRLGKRSSIAKNHYAFRAGEPAQCVCLVEYGHFKVLEPKSDGRDVIMFIRAPGEILGLRGALQKDGNGMRTYTAQACENSEILATPASKFRSYLLEHPHLALEVAEILSERLNETCGKLSSLALTQVPSRVACLILNVGRCYGTLVGKGVDLNVPFSQQEIADMVGAARQTVSSILTTLKLEGVISVSHKHIRIENIEQLKKLAASNALLELETGPTTGAHGISSKSDRRGTPR